MLSAGFNPLVADRVLSDIAGLVGLRLPPDVCSLQHLPVKQMPTRSSVRLLLIRIQDGVTSMSSALGIAAFFLTQIGSVTAMDKISFLRRD
eukprot:TRINITY_DN30394_c0_g1_i1.p1 TRINITY_DN30394_c0_g1~~TRINITY_DN30394_c0_g1_i1.p1  ORF type:complete len:104 (+),score=3.66 TRINITY_DN30394_c0_g1_i1:40-312(+)